MIKTSIVPEILNSEGITLHDVNGVKVQICKKSNFLFNYGDFVRPSITINILEKTKYKNVEIKRIGLEQLEEIGYRVLSIKTSAKIRNRPRQNKSYFIQPIESPILNAYPIIKLPSDHLIEYDIINNRIRLRGHNVWPYNISENATPWIEVMK